MPYAESVEGFMGVYGSYKEKERDQFKKWFMYKANEEEMKPSNIAFVVIGTFFLWVSWLFFNGGSTVDSFSVRTHNTPKIILNTLLAGSSAGIVANFLKPRLIKKDRFHDIGALCNGVLTGLVSITGVCDDVPSYLGFIIGIIGGVVYCLGCKFVAWAKVDDPI